MSQTRNLVLLAGAALSLGQVSAVLADEPVSTTNKDEVRAIVADMLSDAQSRSSLLQAGAAAGHDGKFFIASPDNNFRLNIGGDEQFRYMADFRDRNNVVSGGNGGDDFDGGFVNRITRIHFDGHVINPDWTYKVQFNFERGDSSTGFGPGGGVGFLEDAYIQYNLGNGWNMRMGQFKLPLLREELVDNTMQLAAERSLVNNAFTQSRSQGVQFGYEEADWTFAGAFSDGLNSWNTDFTNTALVTTGSGLGAPFVIGGEADYGVTGRFQYKFAGNWEDFNDFTSKPGQGFSAMLGLAAHFQQSPNSSFAGDTDRQTTEYTADLSLEGDGWNAFGAAIGRHDQFRGPAAGSPANFDDFGGVVQGGWRWGNTEVFGRWEGFFPDSDRGFSEDIYHFITVGVNEYYHGHAAKATIDAVWALERTNELAGISAAAAGTGPDTGSVNLLPDTSIGLLGDSKRNEVVVRVQFQLLF